MHVRALLLCHDVRFELGGTLSLIGVYAERIVVEPGDGEIVVPRLAIYTVVAGLTGASELVWKQTLHEVGRSPGDPLADGREVHDPAIDEHRLISLVSPLTLPGPGPYRLAVELRTRHARCAIDHAFVVARA